MAYSGKDIDIKSFTAWDQAIGDFHSTREEIVNLATQLTVAVRKQLSEQGITGEVADKLVESYKEDIEKKINIFLEAYDKHVRKSENDESEGMDLISNINNDWENWA